RISGSFQIMSAASCQDYYNLDTKQPVPGWLKLEHPTSMDQGLLWSFSIQTDRPGRLFASLRFECDTGVAICPISLDVKEGTPRSGDIVFCSSPFDHQTPYSLLESLVRILSALRARIHCVDSIAEIGQMRARTVVLHQLGLLRLNTDDVALLI